MTDIDKQPDEIDLTEIVRKLWLGRKTILITTAIFFVIGIFLALISPKKYHSEATLLIETDAGSQTGMNTLIQQIAAASGINISQKQINDALTPDLYPVITQSTPFLLELSQAEVTDPITNKPVSVAHYLKQNPPKTLGGIILEYTIGLPGKVIGLFGKDDRDSLAQEAIVNSRGAKKYLLGKDQLAVGSPLPDSLLHHENPELNKAEARIQSPSEGAMLTPLTRGQLQSIGRLKACITAEATSKSKIKTAAPNMLTVSVEVHDAEVAVELTALVVESLTRYISEYRTRKVKSDLQFIDDQLAEAEVKYRRAQQALAATTDRNQNILLATARTDANRRQSEYELAFNVYNSLVQLKEQAKIKVQENTPVFTLIEPPSKAEKISQGLKIEMIMLFLGFVTGIAIVFGIPAWKKFRKTLKQGE
ncbi:MAG: hypothetical protein EOM90_12115 [Alphaproteobacteria bacterium]|nr:hypothetical protein [Alphaproteobacteria bacterium]